MTVKSVTYSDFGRPYDVLKIVSTEIPRPKDNEVRMTVLVAPIHPSDIVQIHGRYPIKRSLPAVAGNEGIGRVTEIGKSVTNLKVGDIAAIPFGCGTWTTQVNVISTGMIPLVDYKDLKQLSMSRVNPITAHMLLTNHRMLTSGDWIIQTGANSAVGQLATSSGVKTVNIVRSDESKIKVIHKGGDVVLVDGCDLSSRIANATNNAKIYLAFDAVAGPNVNRIIDSLASGGEIINYGLLSGMPLQITADNLIFRNIIVKGFWLTQWMLSTPHSMTTPIIQSMTDLIMQGKLKVDVDSTFCLDDVKKAIERSKSPSHSGKVLLLPNGEI